MFSEKFHSFCHMQLISLILGALFSVLRKCSLILPNATYTCIFDYRNFIHCSEEHFHSFCLMQLLSFFKGALFSALKKLLSFLPNATYIFDNRSSIQCSQEISFILLNAAYILEFSIRSS